MRTRTLSLVVVCLLLGLALAACSGDSSTASPAAQALLTSSKTRTAETAANAAAPAAGGALLTIGEQSLTAEALGALPRATAATDDGDMTGASLLAALETAGITGGSVTLAASDGYTTDVDLAEVDDSAVLVVGEDGTVDVIIPTLPKATWVEDLVAITVS